MPRFNPNLRISDAHGSMGNVSFYHVDGKCHWRTKPQPQFPGSEQQLLQLSVHRRAIAAWKQLDSVTQTIWNTLATDVPSHRPPFDQSSHISGYNLFVSAYHGFTQLGSEQIPQPRPYPIFPKTVLEITGSTVGPMEQDLQLQYSISTTDGEPIPEHFRPVARIQLAPPYAGRNQSLMRTFLSDPNARTFTLKDYLETWPALQDQNPADTTMRLFMQYALIDASSGYRGPTVWYSTFVKP